MIDIHKYVKSVKLSTGNHNFGVTLMFSSTSGGGRITKVFLLVVYVHSTYGGMSLRNLIKYPYVTVIQG